MRKRLRENANNRKNRTFLLFPFSSEVKENRQTDRRRERTCFLTEKSVLPSSSSGLLRRDMQSGWQRLERRERGDSDTQLLLLLEDGGIIVHLSAGSADYFWN